MEIVRLESNKIKISVTGAELESHRVTYDQLSSDDPSTKMMISKLLCEATERVGFSHLGKKLFIETFPDMFGGCVLYFTAIAKTPPQKKAQMPRPVAFVAPEIDPIYGVAEQIMRRSFHKVLGSALYERDGAFYLVVYPLLPFEGEASALAGEYLCGTDCAPALQAAMEEHGRELIPRLAIETLLQMK